MKTRLFFMLALLLVFTACNRNNAGHSHDGHDHAHEDHDHDHDHDGDHDGEIIISLDQAQQIGLETEVVQPGTFTSVIKVAGNIQSSPGDEQMVVASTSGLLQLSNPSLSVGSAINKGQSIARIQPSNFQEGDPTKRAKNEYLAAKAELERAESLIKGQIISQKEYESIQLRYQNAKNIYDTQVGQTSNGGGVGVTSPLTGFLKQQLVSHGEYVNMGQPIALIAQNKSLQLRAEVPEKYFHSLNTIQTANFKTSYNDEVFQLANLDGRVLSFGRSTSGGNPYIPITFQFNNVGAVIPGSFAEVYLLTSPLEDVITIPVSALTEQQGLYYVYLQEGEEVYKRHEVTIGHNDGERVLIQNGLTAGDQVVTKGVYQVKIAALDGMVPEGHTH